MCVGGRYRLQHTCNVSIVNILGGCIVLIIIYVYTHIIIILGNTSEWGIYAWEHGEGGLRRVGTKGNL